MLVAVVCLQALFKQQSRGVEKAKAKSVTREFPVAFAGNGLFEKRKIKEQAKVAVDKGVFGSGELQGVFKAVA